MTPRRVSGDGGSAVVEFVVLAVLMLVPVVYLVLCVGQVQAAAFAVEGASRGAAAVIAAAPDDVTGGRQAQAAVGLALADQGLGDADDPDPRIEVRCSASPCTTPQATVRVRVEVDVVLPGVPGLLDAVVPTRVPVSADAVVVVDRFRAVGP